MGGQKIVLYGRYGWASEVSAEVYHFPIVIFSVVSFCYRTIIDSDVARRVVFGRGTIIF